MKVTPEQVKEFSKKMGVDFLEGNSPADFSKLKQIINEKTVLKYIEPKLPVVDKSSEDKSNKGLLGMFTTAKAQAKELLSGKNDSPKKDDSTKTRPRR